jgi:hypothetical protein
VDPRKRSSPLRGPHNSVVFCQAIAARIRNEKVYLLLSMKREPAKIHNIVPSLRPAPGWCSKNTRLSNSWSFSGVMFLTFNWEYPPQPKRSRFLGNDKVEFVHKIGRLKPPEGVAQGLDPVSAMRAPVGNRCKIWLHRWIVGQ